MKELERWERVYMALILNSMMLEKGEAMQEFDHLTEGLDLEELLLLNKALARYGAENNVQGFEIQTY